jgi:hypothetical protein
MSTPARKEETTNVSEAVVESLLAPPGYFCIRILPLKRFALSYIHLIRVGHFRLFFSNRVVNRYMSEAVVVPPRVAVT